MIIIVNRGLNENGAKKMNEYIIELRDKKLKDPEYLATLWIFERKIHSGMCKPVKVGDKIGSATKTYKRDWDSVKEYATIGTHLGYTLPLDYFDYEIIKV